jgi:hypothetical protein
LDNNNLYNLKIYLILTNESTSTKFSWLTDSYVAVTGTQYIYECNNDGTKTLVQTVPIINGDAYANIELVNQPYSYTVLYNGVVYSDTNAYSICHTESSNTINYFINLNSTDVTQPIGLYSIQCNLTKSSNTTALMIWGNNPLSSLPLTGCIFAYRNGINGLEQTYSSCVNNTNSIERTIPESGYSYVIKGKLYQGGYSVSCPNALSFYDDVPTARTFGLTGLFSAILLILSLALFFVGDDVKQQAGAIFGVILSWFLGLLNFDWRVITSICAFVIIIMWIGRSARK